MSLQPPARSTLTGALATITTRLLEEEEEEVEEEEEEEEVVVGGDRVSRGTEISPHTGGDSSLL